MSIDTAGLMVLGVLNLALGVLIVFVCLRLSTLSKLIGQVEERISRLEILISLADSRDSIQQRAAKQKVGGTS